MIIAPACFIVLGLDFLSVVSLVEAIGNLTKELQSIMAEKPELEKSVWWKREPVVLGISCSKTLTSPKQPFVHIWQNLGRKIRAQIVWLKCTSSIFSEIKKTRHYLKNAHQLIHNTFGRSIWVIIFFRASCPPYKHN